eukprot:Hpha_TRINITY_DN22121_c0_g1::TRINITY_DN22121_c0_g1_i1::g.103670::m.103670
MRTAHRWADVIFVGRFRTQRFPGQAGDIVECIAADEAGRIMGMGGAGTILKKWKGETTRVEQLPPDSVAVPGFVESHVHLILAGEAVHDRSVDCSPTSYSSFGEMMAELGAAADRLRKSHPRGDPSGLVPFVVGWSFDDVLWGQDLTKEVLDGVCGDVCVLVWHASLHSVYVNSAALKVAGLTKETPQPPGGMIVTDPETGELTGELRESPAFAPVRLRMLPGPGSSQRDASVLDECAWAAANKWVTHGITSVHDMLVAGEKL